jgi:O-antigen/teichoic acid export membrane protein
MSTTANAPGKTVHGRLKAMAKSGSIYLFFSLLIRAIPFLLLPVLTRYIEPAGYGVVTVVMIVIGIATPLIGMCSNSVLFQRFYKLDAAGRVDFITDCYKIIFMTAGVYAQSY